MPVTITGSTSIDYDINGEGQPLLLIGGLGFGRWGWFKQVPSFARHFRTITFDIRGERRLENGVGDLVGDVVSLLDHLGVKKAHVLGASLGGPPGCGVGSGRSHGLSAEVWGRRGTPSSDRLFFGMVKSNTCWRTSFARRISLRRNTR